MSRRNSLLASTIGGGGNTPITFYLKVRNNNLHEFNIPYSMTWEEFVDSEYNTVNEFGDKSFRDHGIIQYGEVYCDATPDGKECYTEYVEVYKNDIVAALVFSDEYIREDINYMT